MKKIISISHPNYLEFIFTGNLTYQNSIELIEMAFAECQNKNIKKALLDIHNAKRDLKEFDRYKIGIKASELFQRPYRLLVIERKKRINKFAENTAVNRGAEMLVTDDKEGGLAWLLSKKCNYNALPREGLENVIDFLREIRQETT